MTTTVSIQDPTATDHHGYVWTRATEPRHVTTARGTPADGAVYKRLLFTSTTGHEGWSYCLVMMTPDAHTGARAIFCEATPVEQVALDKFHSVFPG